MTSVNFSQPVYDKNNNEKRLMFILLVRLNDFKLYGEL